MKSLSKSRSVLVLNSGSSSLKFGVYDEEQGRERLVVSGEAERIGGAGGKMTLQDAERRELRSAAAQFASAGDALAQAVAWIGDRMEGAPAVIGHRVVHGGPRLVRHQEITPEVLSELRACVHFAPVHIPGALGLIEKAGQCYPGVPQFACFDTVFHATMPEVASRFALPTELYAEGVRRYGFHGLSYESIVYQLGDALGKRTVIAHLGNGASLAAVCDGKSVDTSMGLTPTGGIPMSTRAGDLDPGVLLYLQRTKGMDSDALEKLLNQRSGLLALSDGKADMRDLEKAAVGGDEKAQLAIDIFCVAIRKMIAAYAAVLGGLDMLVFAGGIGEHSARVRAAVCDGLGFLGVALDPARNDAHESVISTDGSAVCVRIVAAAEDYQIARHCRAWLRGA